ncbi:hypothetical protein EYZ11_006566 [Aspergillus tanneri]|uniref:Uncharacterized protein n=1 Tax=Aspergillus tanneri TaxID=1220188 RepID=A0A4S3JFP4_9EURO|nr:hypothetical protein EYZ11_006566 [Aspergillus tanneri]
MERIIDLPYFASLRLYGMTDQKTYYAACG